MKHLLIGLFIIFGIVGHVAASAETPTATTYGVKSNGDGGDADLTDKNCADRTGTCTLRAAIEQANAYPDEEITITFEYGEPVTFSPASPYPAITRPITIDGVTKAACPNPDQPGTLLVTISGISAGSGASGITLGTGSDGSVIQGLVIVNFDDAGIRVESNSNQIYCNYLGINRIGNAANSNTYGVRVRGDNNLIGESIDPERSNLISGNSESGLFINGASGTQIRGNLIGLNGSGSGAVGNDVGLMVDDNSQNTTIGGSTSSRRNFISGNSGKGIYVDSSDVVIRGNYIGTAAMSGLQAVPNGTGVASLKFSSLIVEDNVISGNTYNGISIQGGATLLGNKIGMASNGTTTLSNGAAGVYVGVYVTYQDYAGMIRPDNVYGANITIGGNSTGDSNIIAGNDGWQIELTSFAGLSGILPNYSMVADGPSGDILNNQIGVGATGSPAAGDGGGILIPAISDVTISGNNIVGSYAVPAVNAVCTTQYYCDPTGPYYNGEYTHENVLIENNLIGVKFDGTLAWNRGSTAVLLEQVSRLTLRNNTIGSGAAAYDVQLTTGPTWGIQTFGSTHNTVFSNTIGIYSDGSGDLNSGTVGLSISDLSEHNVIEGNALSADSGPILELLGDNNTINGNYLGTDSSMTLDAGDQIGLYINNAADNTVYDNVIAFNGTGVVLEGSNNNDFYGNGIGTNTTGATNLGNDGVGILVSQDSHDNTIGGDGNRAYNQIRNNGGHGIQINDTVTSISDGTTMWATAFADNGGLAIELGNSGVTLNDGSDSDNGPNDLQNFPVLNSVASNGDVSGFLTSSSGQQFRIDVYQSFECDPSGYGEGGQFYGSAIVQTTGSTANFTISPVVSAPFLPYLTAIATRTSTGNTSEFSACLQNPDGLTFFINDTRDSVNRAAPDSVCDVDMGTAGNQCTLREALTEINAFGIDFPFTINFDLPEGSVIQVATQLPQINAPIFIDGFTAGDSNGCSETNAVAPTIGVTLDGGNDPDSGIGLLLHNGSDGSTVRGLAFTNFDNQGIFIGGSGGLGDLSRETHIYCNFVGVAADGTTDGANGSDGIYISGQNHTVSSNIIGFNAGDGIDAGGQPNVIRGNGIGTNFDGSADLGNTGNGINFRSISYSYTVSDNVIHNNGAAGIRIAQQFSGRHALYINSIRNNGGLGIDLGTAGVTPNDTGDGDTGWNDLQNFPVLNGQNSCNIEGTLNSKPNTQYRVDVYYTTSCDSDGEGANYFGTITDTTDASGNLSFSVPSHNDTTGYPYFVATATDLSQGNTSEFSACYAYENGTPTLVGIRQQGSGITSQRLLVAGVALLGVMTIWGVRRRRYLVLVLVGLCVAAVGIDRPTPVLAETSSSCTVVGDILADGGTVEGDGGVLLGAPSGSLPTAVPVDVSQVATPAETLMEDATLTRVSNFYAVSSAETILAANDSLFLVGVPVTSRVNTANLAVAILTDNSTLLDASESGRSWMIAPVSYDPATGLASFSLSQLFDGGTIFALVEGASFSPIDPPTARTVAFDVWCGAYTPSFLCTQSALTAYGNEFLTAYNEFVGTYGFRAPALKNTYTRFQFNNGSYIPTYDPVTTFYGLFLVDKDICDSQPDPFAGRYNPTTQVLEVCIDSPLVTTNGRKILRHELFHAIQFAYPKMRSGSRADTHWVYEGTATAVMESSSPLQRTNYFPPYHKLYQPINDGTDTIPYFAQEFWVFHNQGTFGLYGLRSLFDNYGPRLEDVDRAVMGLDTRYWEWAKNHAYERTYDYSGGLAGTCQPTISNPNVIGATIDYTFDTNVEPTFRESGTVNPYTAQMWKITIARDEERLVFGIIPDDPNEETFQKFYRVSDSNCISAPETSDALFENVTAGEVFYVLVAKAPYDGIPDGIGYDLQIIASVEG